MGSDRVRVLVTGGAGFVGSHLVDRLAADGTAVLVVDDLSTGLVDNVPAGARLEQLDITTARLEALLRAWKPALVFHLAAQANVAMSVQDPLRDEAVNVIGTARLLDAARHAGARRFVFVSSGGAIYGSRARAADERSRPNPASPYGLHKLQAERLVARAGIAHAILRPSNIYGPRQLAGLEGAVVATFIEQARSSGSLTIHGDGLQSRDFVHVRDVIAALSLLGREDAPVGTWNVSRGQATTVLSLASIVEAAVGHPLGRVWRGPRLGDVRTSAISSARLRSLGWLPVVELQVGIAELVLPSDR
jgi:UDP-glucose 4-epimerase